MLSQGEKNLIEDAIKRLDAATPFFGTMEKRVAKLEEEIKVLTRKPGRPKGSKDKKVRTK